MENRKKYSLKADHYRFVKVLTEASQLRWKKLNDYGASYREFGPLGVAVRMGDKMRRMEMLLQKGHVTRVKSESLRDTAVDLLNYSVMLVMLLDEKKGGKL